MPGQYYRSFLGTIACALLLIFSSYSNAAYQGVVTKTEQMNFQTITISVTVPVPQGSYLYYDYINFSVSNSAVALSTWQSSISAVDQYDLSFNKSMRMYTSNVTFNTQATIANTPTDNRRVSEATVDFSYLLSSIGERRTITIPLQFSPQMVGDATSTQEHASDLQPTTHDRTLHAVTEKTAPTNSSARTTTETKKFSFSGTLSSLIETTDNIWVRALLVLLLGMLLSLTPCIYPMIPITAGILQAHGKKSVGYNFLISCCYVAGIATTFALLGLLASSTGQMIGSFTSTPWFMIFMAALLAYMAGSMFGWYELYTPKFMTAGNKTFGGNACISAFLFGTVSGSIASPCVSPGLVLVLGLVTTIGSKLLGFLLLFLFGIGLGFPLLLVGTFSSSINMLPRAGAWMLEIKKLVGFMLLGTSLYFIRGLIPTVAFVGATALLMLAAAISFFISARNTHALMSRWTKNFAGTALIVTSFLFVAQTYKAILVEPSHCTIWETNYFQAHSRAQEENKLLFIDVGSPFCTLCTAIDNKTLALPEVCDALSKCVCVKVDSSDTSNNASAELQKKYEIVGVPAFLLIDPKTGEVRKRWSGELYSTPHTEFIDSIEQIVASEPVYSEASLSLSQEKSEQLA